MVWIALVASEPSLGPSVRAEPLPWAIEYRLADRAKHRSYDYVIADTAGADPLALRPCPRTLVEGPAGVEFRTPAHGEGGHRVCVLFSGSWSMALGRDGRLGYRLDDPTQPRGPFPGVGAADRTVAWYAAVLGSLRPIG